VIAYVIMQEPTIDKNRSGMGYPETLPHMPGAGHGTRLIRHMLYCRLLPADFVTRAIRSGVYPFPRMGCSWELLSNEK